MSKIQLTCSTLIKSLAAIFRTFSELRVLKSYMYINPLHECGQKRVYYRFLIQIDWCYKDAFLLGVHIVLGIDIQQTSFIFCKNAEGVKTISFLYQDCCIILIQHIRSFFLLMEFEASEYVLDFTNHGKKNRNII